MLFTIAIFRIKSSVEVDAGVDLEAWGVTKVVITGPTTEVTMVVDCPDPPVEENRGGAGVVATASDDVVDGDDVASDAAGFSNPRSDSSSSLMFSSTSNFISSRSFRRNLSTPDILMWKRKQSAVVPQISAFDQSYSVGENF